jgi:hypothetical protein
MQPLNVQAKRFCEVLHADSNINGMLIDIIGFEDGGLVARAAAQMCLENKGTFTSN